MEVDLPPYADFPAPLREELQVQDRAMHNSNNAYTMMLSQ